MEAVGLLAATLNGVVVECTALENEHPDPAHAVFVSEMTVNRHRARLDAANLAFAGLYHSHPDGHPVLSAADRVSLKRVTFLWLIALRRADLAEVYAFGKGAHGEPRYLPLQVEGTPHA